MQLSGHRTANVFDRYDIHDLADLEAATAKLARSQAGSEPETEASKGRVSYVHRSATKLT